MPTEAVTALNNYLYENAEEAAVYLAAHREIRDLDNIETGGVEKLNTVIKIHEKSTDCRDNSPCFLFNQSASSKRCQIVRHTSFSFSHCV